MHIQKQSLVIGRLNNTFAKIREIGAIVYDTVFSLPRKKTSKDTTAHGHTSRFTMFKPMSRTELYPKLRGFGG
jgi:ABC-type uncharacterized transport system permease subunit